MSVWNPLTKKWEEESDYTKSFSNKLIQDNTPKQEKEIKVKYSNKPLSNLSTAPLASVPKTILTTTNYIGQGTLKGIEGVADALLDVGTSNINPYYWFNQDKLEDHKAMARQIIETDATNQLITKLSGDENFNQNVLDKGSLVKSTNIGGQVAQGIGQMLPAIALGNPTAATGTIGVSSYGSGVEEAYKDGANTTQARLYGLGNMATEMATEWLTGGVPGVKSKLFSGLDNIVAKGLGKETLEEVSQSLTKELLQAGYKMVGEGTEEALTEILKPLLKNTIYTDGEKINWEEVINSFIVGAITGGVLEAPTNISNVKYAYKNTVNNVRNLGQNNNNNVLAPLAVNNVNTGIKNSLNIDTNNAYQYEVSDNQKINAFNESIKNSGLINSETTKSFADICTKVIQDRDVNILVDSTLENNVNGLYDANTNTIKINPNSERAAEFILTHELTHSIATDEMIRLANDYASKNLDFKTSVESLLNQYNKTEIDEEVLADISGQLFGNQEFINNLSMQEPSLFKKIYNKIIEWANKLTGNTHEALFMRDLKNKWETAYRNSTKQNANNNLGNEIKLSKKIGGYYPNIETATADIGKFGINDYNNLKEVKQKIYDYYKEGYISNEQISKPITNIDTGLKIEIWKNGINETFGNEKYYKSLSDDNKKIKLATMDGLAKMIKYGEVRNAQAKNYHNNNSTATYYYLEHPITIDGIKYMVNMDIRKVPNYNGRFYIHSVDTKKIGTPGTSKKSPLTVPTYVNNISQSNSNVKSDTSSTKYSMQETVNNTQELDNSSFSLEQDDISKDVSKNTIDVTNYKTNYENVPDSLMGFSDNDTNNKKFNETKYPYTLDLLISVDGGKTFFEDSIKGMNYNHALERAKRNWEEAIFREKKTGIKYSLNEKGILQDINGDDVTLETSETGTHGTLMAIHNLSEEKLRGILELGGFPVPSIAITNPKIVNHNQFGKITVLFDKNTINPSNKLNEVYDRDVWSPTFPTIDSEINKKNIESVADEIGIKDYYNKGGITLIEWSDLIKNDLPEERLEITFKVIDENTRVLLFKPFGKVYEELCESIL